MEKENVKKNEIKTATTAADVTTYQRTEVLRRWCLIYDNKTESQQRRNKTAI